MQSLVYTNRGSSLSHGSGRGSKKLPLLQTTYDPGWLEEIVSNNKFDIAHMTEFDFAEFEAKILAIIEQEKPSLFYYWEPAVFRENLKDAAQRVWLPNERCGTWPNSKFGLTLR